MDLSKLDNITMAHLKRCYPEAMAEIERYCAAAEAEQPSEPKTWAEARAAISNAWRRDEAGNLHYVS